MTRHLPRSQTVWVMEVRTTCKVCRGTGQVQVRLRSDGPLVPDPNDPNPCYHCGGGGRAWYAVHPGSGDPYTYLTRSDAARMLNTCYPDQCRCARLGDDEEAAGVRVTECTVNSEGELVRVYDGSKV